MQRYPTSWSLYDDEIAFHIILNSAQEVGSKLIVFTVYMYKWAWPENNTAWLYSNEAQPVTCLDHSQAWTS